MSLRPLVTICGTTGVGKSKLAIELALALSQHRYAGYRGARIINADAMQVYAGIDILTNKVPVEEQAGVEHLLMGFRHPGEQYVVGDWVRDAMQLIEETHQRQQVPIVVGGTSYWIQHLVFPGRLAGFNDQLADASRSPATTEPSERLAQAVAQLPPELLPVYDDLEVHAASAAADAGSAFALHRLLAALDPPVAQRWHWKDTRKVLRSLELIQQTGRLSSEIIAEQSQADSQPRYRTLCFWLYAKPDVLYPRLDARVDQMLEQGLLREVEELMQATTRSGKPTQVGEDGDAVTGTGPEASASSIDYTLGLYQSIGYREFSSYLARDARLPDLDRERAFQAAVERMKISTRQYAKRQVSWIRNKFLPAAAEANRRSRQGPDGGSPGDIVPTFLLDATELGDSWATAVQEPACRIMQDFLEQRPLPDPLTLSDTARQLLTIAEKPTAPSAVLSAQQLLVCPSCTTDERNQVMIARAAWKAHEGSRRHRRLAARQKRAAGRQGNEASPSEQPQDADTSA